MSDHTARGNDRRQAGRREVDITTHILEQSVLSAAVRFVEIEADGPVDERIARHRELRIRVRDYLTHAEQGQVDFADLVLIAVVMVLVVVPGSLIGQGWGRYFLVLIGLAACATLLIRGERS